MIRGRCVELDRQDRGVLIAELVGVNSGNESEGTSGSQNLLPFVTGEHTSLDEDVAELREPVARGSRHDRPSDRIDPRHTSLRVTSIDLGRKLVGRETGRDQANGRSAGGRADRTQLLELILEIQAIPALGLGGRRSPRRHPRRALQNELDERVFVGTSRLPHGRSDSTAAGGDRLVTFAVETAIELRLTRPREREVRMRVDETRQGSSSPGVHLVVQIPDQIPRKVRLRSDPLDQFIPDDDRSVGNDSQCPHRRSTGSFVTDGSSDLCEIADQGLHSRDGISQSRTRGVSDES